MATEAATAAGVIERRERLARIAPHWPLLLGLLIMAVPTIVRMGSQTWSTEAGAHGPIVLATGLWLLSYNKIRLLAPGERILWPIVILAGIVAGAIYAFGRAYDFISLEVLGLYLICLTAAYRLCGASEVKRNAFPFFYLAFVIPPPGWLIDQITAPLRTFVSYAALAVLEPLGYPISRQGVSLMVAQYQLLVEDACAGMNSLVGLTAISLFYIYMMHRASWRYAVVLLALIIPVAVIVNIIRVLALILITYYFGDAAAQGFLHVTTGLVLFGVALMMIFVIDTAFQHILAGWRRMKAA